VNPPKVNNKINAIAKYVEVSHINVRFEDQIVVNQLKIFIPVGTAIIIVTEVK
jgi:hypothetical protein